MPEEPTKPDAPSLRNFDYFDEKDSASLGEVEGLFLEDSAEGEPPSGVDDEFDESRELTRARRHRELRQFVLSLMFFGVAIWGVASYRDLIEYAFGPPVPARPVGNIVDAPRGSLKHNEYIQIEGLTMHRGLVQSIVRTIGFSRRELHYFELAGAGGVFVEVPPELGIEFASYVNVSGRVVDPKRTSSYSPLLAKYEERYYQERRPHERIIQVGVAPGEGRTPFILLFGLLAAMASLNVWTLARVIRSRRRSAPPV